VEELARQLRLDGRVVEALERDDFAALPEMTFVKGYVRSYAKFVGLEPAPLLAALPGADAVPKAALRRTRTGEVRGLGPRFPWGGLFKALLLLMLLGGLGLLGYRVAERLWNQPESVDETDNALTLPGMGEPSAGGESAPGRLPLPALPPAPERAPVAPPVPASEPETEAEPEAGALPEAEPAAVASPPASPAPAPEPVTGPQTGGTALVLEFLEDSWSEVRDRDGRILVGLMKAGTRREVVGEPPFKVVLGNSPGVRLEYAGRPFDQSRYNRGRVARFTLGEP
jgi:cytoskeleton protein RodZ